ncbi:MAG: hypothetical protein HQL75_15160 [Magnetococcales bacterium]|nr:hypothetical protein [Magnetococcales bacterium]
MIASMPIHVGKVTKNRLELLFAFQEIGNETTWDYVSQQMESSETLMDIAQTQMKRMFQARNPYQAVETWGNGAVSLGKAVLDHAIATTDISRTAERQAMDLFIDAMSACLKNKAALASGGTRLN